MRPDRSLRDTLRSHAAPAPTYAAALERAAALKARDDHLVQPACYTQLLTHGAQVSRAAVLLHGYTNCPYELSRLGAALFERGMNVLVPRMPYHGLRDRMTSELGRITLAEQTRLVDEAIDIAHGLGRTVTVVGVCSGGAFAAWAAQFRSDLDTAVLVAPALMAATIPPPLAPATLFLLEHLPNLWLWWDRRLKARLRWPPYAYPRFSTHALGTIFRLAREVLRAAQTAPPLARRILVVCNGADHVVNAALIAQLCAAWSNRGAAPETYSFPAELHLPHDFIDPHHPGSRVTLVYPVLVPLIEGLAPALP